MSATPSTFAHAGWALSALASHWRRRPGQLAATVLGLMLATALWAGVQALNQHARESYDRAAALFGGPGAVMLAATAGATIDQSLFIDLRRNGWAVSPMIEGRIELPPDTPGERPRVRRLVGVEPVTAPPSATAASLGEATGAPDDGGGDLLTFLTPPGRAFVASDSFSELGLSTNQPWETVDGRPLPPPVAREGLAPNVVVVDIGVAQRVLGLEGRVTRLVLDAEARPGATPIAELSNNALRRVEVSEEADLARLTDSFHLNLSAFGLLSFVVGLFIAHAAIGLTFEQRLPTIRTLRACGVSARMLTVVLAVELAIIALAAGVAGLALGYVIAGALLPDVAATLRGLYGAAVPGSLRLEPAWWAAGLGMTLLGAGVAAAQSLARAYHLPLLAVAQPTAWRDAHRRAVKRQAALGVGLLTGAGLALAFGSGLLAAFAVLAGLLLGTALLLPALLSAALGLGERLSRRPLSRWFWADSRQQLGGLTLALMALLLALSANIGVGTMVEGFRKTFTGWLDQRLASEVFVSPETADQAEPIGEWLSARPEVSAALPSWRTEARVDGWPITVVGFEDHATYRDHWPTLAAAPDLWEIVAAGDAALFSEQLARRLGVWVGDEATVDTPVGPWSVRVAAVYPDYGNPEGQIGVANAAFLARWPAPERVVYSVRTDPDAAPALIGAVRAEFNLDETRAIDQATLKAYSQRVFNQTFTVTAALNALTLAVAGAALLASLLTLAQMRLPHLAPLWAMGVTRRRLALLDLLKTVALALLTALLAVPLGLALAWALVAVVNVEAFGWRLPLHLFPRRWLELVGLALATAALAAAWPAWKLRRTPPAELVKVFSEER